MTRAIKVKGEQVSFLAHADSAEQLLTGTATGGTGTAGVFKVKGTYLYWIDNDGNERRKQGTLTGNPREAGDIIVHGKLLYYGDYDGDERSLSALPYFLIAASGSSGRLARDSSGKLWCVYHDGSLSLKSKFSTDDGETWGGEETVVTVAYLTQLMLEHDICIDSQDRPHVVFTYRTSATVSTNRRLYHTYRDPVTGWTTKEDIAGVEDYFKYPRIAVDSNDDIHCAYHRDTLASGAAYYIKRTGTTWGSQFRLEYHGNKNIWSHDIAVDASNNVHVVYISRRGRSVYHREYTSSWQAEDTLFTTDDYDVDQFGIKIALDSNGDVHVVWSGNNEAGTYPLKHNLRYCKGITGAFAAIEELTDVDYHQVAVFGQNATIFDLQIAITTLDKIDIVWKGTGGFGFEGYVNRLHFDGSWGSVTELSDMTYPIYDMLWAWHPEFWNILVSNFMLVVGSLNFYGS